MFSAHVFILALSEIGDCQTLSHSRHCTVNGSMKNFFVENTATGTIRALYRRNWILKKINLCIIKALINSLVLWLTVTFLA